MCDNKIMFLRNANKSNFLLRLDITLIEVFGTLDAQAKKFAKEAEKNDAFENVGKDPYYNVVLLNTH